VKPPDRVPRRIAAAVVDEDDFPLLARAIQRLGKTPSQFGQVFLFVEDGDDDGDHGMR
jgi:hypothetical protein